MNESDVIRMVRQMIRQELAPILMATISANATSQRSSAKRFQTDSGVDNLRNIQPYGIASRAPAGTQAMMAPVNFDPTHLNIIGHFDSAKPDMEDGETILYDQYGHMVYLSQSKMQFGSNASANPMVLGDILQSILSQFMQAFVQHTHPAPGYVPANASVVSSLQEQVDAGDTVSGKAFTEK